MHDAQGLQRMKGSLVQPEGGCRGQEGWRLPAPLSSRALPPLGGRHTALGYHSGKQDRCHLGSGPCSYDGDADTSLPHEGRQHE